MKKSRTINKLRIQNNKLAKVFGSITIICVVITSVFSSLQNYFRELIKSVSNPNLSNLLSSLLANSYLFLIPIAIIAALGVFYFKVIDVEEVAKEFLALENKVSKLEIKDKYSKDEIVALAAQQAAILSGLSTLEGILYNQKDFLDEEKSLKAIINPLVLIRDQALGFSNGGFYNFVVYKFDKDKGLLIQVFRDCDKRIEVHNREWAPGEGHVGLSFQKDEPLIHSDVISTSTIQPPKKKAFVTDGEYYNSFISAAIIGDAKKFQERLGVFVITSSKANQFNSSHKFLASSYTILINLYYTEIKKFMESNQDGKA